jgi:hypothetical protein
MQNRNHPEHSTIRTQRRGLFAWLRSIRDGRMHPLILQVRLKGEPNVLYPRMSRGEIRYVAAAICQAALKNAK